MTTLHFVKKARKDNPVVKAGQPYYWWKFAYGSKRYSEKRPPRSALTQSSFLSQLYDLEDSIDVQGESDLEGHRDSIVERLEEMRDECQESFDNIPESLQEAPSGELLQERIDGLESWGSDLENIDCEQPETFGGDQEYASEEEWREQVLSEIFDTNPGLG